MKYALAVVVILALATAAHGEWRAVLWLEPRVTLPGIPVNISIRLRNVGKLPAAAPHQLLLIGQAAGAAAHVAPCGSPVADLEAFVDRVISPGEEVVASLPNDGTLLRSSCWGEPLLSEPGVYEYRAYLAKSNLGGDSADWIGEAPARAEVTAGATLTILKPVGDDAAVWERMNTLAKPGWDAWLMLRASGRELGRAVLKEYPRSTYAGWFATTGVGETLEESSDALREWLETLPADSASELRWQRVVDWELGAAAEHGSVNPVERDRHLERSLRVSKRLRSAAAREEVLERVRGLCPGEPTCGPKRQQ